MEYPNLKKWSIKSLRYSLAKLVEAGLEQYPDKSINGRPISRQMLEAEIARRSPAPSTQQS